MLPNEIIEFINSRLPIMQRDAEVSSKYYFYHGSGLNSDQWEELTTALIKYALATRPVGGALKLTAEGEEVATAGPNGYKKFVKRKEREAKDPATTNKYTRVGIVLSTILSFSALIVSCLAYRMPDNNAIAIQKLREVRVSDSIKLTRLRTRIDSLAHRGTGVSPAATAKPSPLPTNAKKQALGPTPPPTPTGKSAAAK